MEALETIKHAFLFGIGLAIGFKVIEKGDNALTERGEGSLHQKVIDGRNRLQEKWANDGSPIDQIKGRFAGSPANSG